MSVVNTTELLLSLNAQVQQLKAAGDVRWTVLTGSNCFFMLLGFAMLEAGSLRAKNLSAVMLKKFVVPCVVGVVWFLWGHAIGFGVDVNPDKRPNNFIGTSFFALGNVHHDNTAPYSDWFYQLTFCAVSCSIISGAIGERVKFNIYFIFLFLVSGWIYPIVAYSQWSTGGWNSPFNDGNAPHRLVSAAPFTGVIDFAGCGPVHIVGGMCAFVAAWFVGPRHGRFNADMKSLPMPGHNSAYVTMGVLMLWYGWFSFNSGGRIKDQERQYLIAGRSCMATALASCSAGLTVLLVRGGATGFNVWPLTACLNGVISGLVAITAGSVVVEPWGAFVIGIVASLVYMFMSWFILEVLHVDDPVDASAVHVGSGVVGIFLTGLLAQPDAVRIVYDLNITTAYAGGAFMGGDGHLLGFQILQIIFAGGWAFVFSYIFFFVAEKLVGIRVSSADEEAGLDKITFGGEGLDYLSPLQQVNVLTSSLAALRATLLDGSVESNQVGGEWVVSGGGAASPSLSASSATIHHPNIKTSSASSSQQQTSNKNNKNNGKTTSTAASHNNADDEAAEEVHIVDFGKASSPTSVVANQKNEPASSSLKKI